MGFNSGFKGLTLLWRRATEVEHWGSGKTARTEIVFVVICAIYKYCAFKVDWGRLWIVVLAVLTVLHSVWRKFRIELPCSVCCVYPPASRPGLKLIEMKIRFSYRMKGGSFKTVLCDHVPVDGNGCIWLIWNMLLTCFCLSLNVAIVKYWAWKFGGKDFVVFSRYYSCLVFSFSLPVSGYFLTRDRGTRCVCRKVSNSVSVQQRFSCSVSSNFSYCR